MDCFLACYSTNTKAKVVIRLPNTWIAIQAIQQTEFDSIELPPLNCNALPFQLIVTPLHGKNISYSDWHPPSLGLVSILFNRHLHPLQLPLPHCDCISKLPAIILNHWNGLNTQILCSNIEEMQEVGSRSMYFQGVVQCSSFAACNL